MGVELSCIAQEAEVWAHAGGFCVFFNIGLFLVCVV